MSLPVSAASDAFQAAASAAGSDLAAEPERSPLAEMQTNGRSNAMIRFMNGNQELPCKVMMSDCRKFVKKV